jgi:beta-N-acetylhexosaminidase
MMRSAEHVFVGLPGPDLDSETEALLTEHQPGGVVLFQRNIENAEQLTELVAAVRRAVPEIILSIDAEGGRVDRLKEIVGPAPAPTRLARSPRNVAQEAGHFIGQSLRLFDLDLDFAPVVDVDRGERGNALDDRYLGGRTPAVIQRGRSFLRGLHSAGVGGCLKHFPGLGAAAEDTHLAGARIELSADALKGDLRPFSALGAMAGAVMIGHAVYPALDPDERPASQSAVIIEELLRGRLGFQGVVVSDDLEMQALAPWGNLAVRAEASFAAGCDILLVCQSLKALPDVTARLDKKKHAARREESSLRLEVFRQRLRTLKWAAGNGFGRSEGTGRGGSLESVREGLAALAS